VFSRLATGTFHKESDWTLDRQTLTQSSRPRRFTFLMKAILGFAPFITALMVYLTAWLIMQPLTTGDEPHYFILASSIVNDRDVDLSNNYEDDIIRHYYFSPEIVPHAIDVRGNGTWMSIHYIGLSLLMSPIVYLGGAVQAVRLELILISAVLAHQIFRLLEDTRIAERALIWPVWASIALCMPLLTYSNQVFPEIPAALLTVYGARVVFAREPSTQSFWLAGGAAAVLPWMHVRYLPVAVGITLGLAYLLLDRGIPKSNAQREVAPPRQPGFWLRLLPLFPVAVSFALLPAVFYSWYGTLSPTVLQQSQLMGAPQWTWSSLYTHGVGAVLSPSYGWLPFAPVHWLGLTGLGALLVRFRRAAPLALLIAAAYLCLVGNSLSAGTAFPARYLVVLVPFIAIPLLLIIKTSYPARILFVPLLAFSVALAAMGVANHRDLYSNRIGKTTLPLARNLQDAWPNFSVNPFGSDGFVILPPDAARQTGRLTERRPLDQTDLTVVQASPDRDEAGYLSLPPYVMMSPGTYVARFDLIAKGEQQTREVATVDILAAPDTILGKRSLSLADLAEDNNSMIELPFMTFGDKIQPRVYYTGSADLRLGPVEVIRTSGPDFSQGDFPSWPKTLLWVLGTVFVGTLLVVSRR
jgi:hypothetical protein